MSEINWNTPRRFAVRSIDSVGIALTLCCEIRRFMSEFGLEDPSYKEITLVGHKLYKAGILPERPTQSQRWMALELFRRIGNDKDLSEASLDFLADDLLNSNKTK